MAKITTKLLKNALNLSFSNEDNALLTREIGGNIVHRFGLELVNFQSSSAYEKYIIGWGTKEANFLELLDESQAREIIGKIINPNSPLIILSQGFKKLKVKKIVEEIANIRKVPILDIDEHLGHISSIISSYLISERAETVALHGSLVLVNGVGVMIMGRSGIGKSEAVLELIQAGHIFVTDDTVKVKRIGKVIKGECAYITSGLLEARGIGIISIPFIYGAKSFKPSTNVDLVVEVLPEKDLNTVDRLGNSKLKFEIFDLKIPKIQIPLSPGRSLSSLVVAAANVFLARKQGMDPLVLIEQRKKIEKEEE